PSGEATVRQGQVHQDARAVDDDGPGDPRGSGPGPRHRDARSSGSGNALTREGHRAGVSDGDLNTTRPSMVTGSAVEVTEMRTRPDSTEPKLATGTITLRRRRRARRSTVDTGAPFQKTRIRPHVGHAVARRARPLAAATR